MHSLTHTHRYLSLVGDAADSIPGIAGVGAKTASKWLTQYKDIEVCMCACVHCVCV
jgi:5'-3' exonuclease